MSASDAAPLPRLGEVFFDVRGNSRSMRLSWYGDTGVAVFSIWQNGTCTGTFRLPIGELPRMAEALRRGPGPSDKRAGWAEPGDWADQPDWAGQRGLSEEPDEPVWPEQRAWPGQPDWAEQQDWPDQPERPGQPDWAEQRGWPDQPERPGPDDAGRPGETDEIRPPGYHDPYSAGREGYPPAGQGYPPAGPGDYPAGLAGPGEAGNRPAYLAAPYDPADRTAAGYRADRRPADYLADPPASYRPPQPADYEAEPITRAYPHPAAPGYGQAGYYAPAFPGRYADSDEIGYHQASGQATRTYPADEDSFGAGGEPPDFPPAPSGRG